MSRVLYGLRAGFAYLLRRLRQWFRDLFGETPPYLEFSITTQTSKLQGIRYPVPGGQPIVLIHGTMENTRIWADLGAMLRDSGFDVWMVNLRGKGNGSHRSVVKRYKKGQYGFDFMVTEDAPAIIDYVYKRTGRKLVVGGHSLGAMVLSKSLAGVSRGSDGKVVADAGVAERLSRKVTAFVNMGGPVRFKNLPDFYRWIAKVFKPVTEKMVGEIPSFSGNRAPTLPDDMSFAARSRRRILSAADRAAALLLPKGIVELGNLNEEKSEFTRFREKAMSPFHSDLAEDLARWARTGTYTSVDGFDFERVREIQVPVLVIAGEKDELAPAEDLFREAKFLNAQAVARTVLMLGTSHVDLVYGERAAALAGKAIVEFTRDPISFGHPDRPVLMGKPKR